MSYRDSGVFFLKNMMSRAFIVLWYTVCPVVLVVQHKAHPYSAASVSHFCLRCLASLHQQPQSEPSIISLTNTHNTSQYSSLEASHIHMEWKYGKNQVFVFSGKSPKFYSCCLSSASSYISTPALCVCDIMRNRFFRKEIKGLVSRGERERERSEGQCWGWKQASLPAPSTDPPSS